MGHNKEKKSKFNCYILHNLTHFSHCNSVDLYIYIFSTVLCHSKSFNVLLKEGLDYSHSLFRCVSLWKEWEFSLTFLMGQKPGNTSYFSLLICTSSYTSSSYFYLLIEGCRISKMCQIQLCEATTFTKISKTKSPELMFSILFMQINLVTKSSLN